MCLKAIEEDACIRLLLCVLCSLIRYVVHHWFQSVAAFSIAYGLFIVSHADAAQLESLGLSIHVRDAALDSGKFAFYWITLGILSSIGLGSGLHTFVLFLGPHILRIASFAVLHNSLHFTAQITSYMKVPSSFDVSGLSEAFSPNYANDAWSVRDSSSGSGGGVSLFALALKVAWPSFLWGLGTSIGELPPYFLARAARAAGTALEELQELQKLEHEVDEEGMGGLSLATSSASTTSSSGISGTRVGSPTGRFARTANPLSSAARAQAKARIFRAMSASSMGEAIAAAARSRSPSLSTAAPAPSADATALSASPGSAGGKGRARAGSTPPRTPAVHTGDAAPPDVTVASGGLHAISVAERAKLVVYEAVQAYGFWAVLAAASIPNPLFDLAGLTCGHFGIPFSTFFSATLLGKAVIKVSLQVLFLLCSVLYGLKAFEWVREHSMAWLPYLPGVGVRLARALERAEASILSSQHAMCSPLTHAGWSTEQCRACCTSHFSAPGKGLAQCLEATCSASSAGHSPSSSSGGGLLKAVWGYVLLAMILYFVSTTISSLAQEYAVRQATAAAAGAGAQGRQSGMEPSAAPFSSVSSPATGTGHAQSPGLGSASAGGKERGRGRAGSAGKHSPTTSHGRSSAVAEGAGGSARKRPLKAGSSSSSSTPHAPIRQPSASAAAPSAAAAQGEVEVEEEEEYEVEAVVEMTGTSSTRALGPGYPVSDLRFRCVPYVPPFIQLYCAPLTHAVSDHPLPHAPAGLAGLAGLPRTTAGCPGLTSTARRPSGVSSRPGATRKQRVCWRRREGPGGIWMSLVVKLLRGCSGCFSCEGAT